MDIEEYINDEIKNILSKQSFSTQTTVKNNDVLTIDAINQMIKKIKPTKIIITPNEELYEELKRIPYIDEDCLKFSMWVDKTIIVDMEKLEEVTIKPYIAII